MASLSGLAVSTLGVSSSPVTITKTQVLVYVDTSSARTVNLPAAPDVGEIHIIKDDTGGAAANNITVQGNGANIDGAASITIAVNRASRMLVYSGTQWTIAAAYL